MKTSTRNILIGISSVAVVGSIGYGIHIKIRNNKIDENLQAALEGGANQYGTLEDFPGFQARVYQDSIPKTQNVIKLKDEVARAYAKKIDKAWGITNDDEEAVYQVFRELKDQYQLSQVANWYNLDYKTPLLEKLKDKLNEDERDVIYKIGKQYPKYRVA